MFRKCFDPGQKVISESQRFWYLHYGVIRSLYPSSSPSNGRGEGWLDTSLKSLTCRDKKRPPKKESPILMGDHKLSSQKRLKPCGINHHLCQSRGLRRQKTNLMMTIWTGRNTFQTTLSVCQYRDWQSNQMVKSNRKDQIHKNFTTPAKHWNLA